MRVFLFISILVACAANCQASEYRALVLKGGDLRVLLPGIPDTSSYSTYDIRGEAAAAAKKDSPQKFVFRGIPTQFQSPPIKQFSPRGGDDESVLRAYLNWDAEYFRSQGAKVTVSEPKFEKVGALTKMSGHLTAAFPQRTFTFCFETLRAGDHIASFVCQLDNPDDEPAARELLAKLTSSFKVIPRPFTEEEQIQIIKQQK